MAVHNFKNGGIGVTIADTDTVVYTCPVDTQAVMHSVILANIAASGNATATVKIVDSSNGNATGEIVKNAVIEPGNSLEFDKPISVETGDSITVSAGVSGDVSAVVSVLEIS